MNYYSKIFEIIGIEDSNLSEDDVQYLSENCGICELSVDFKYKLVKLKSSLSRKYILKGDKYE